MLSHSTKETKAKQNLLDIKFDESIRGGMCLALKVPLITYYDLPFITYHESKDYYNPIKINIAFNGNYIENLDIIKTIFKQSILFLLKI